MLIYLYKCCSQRRQPLRFTFHNMFTCHAALPLIILFGTRQPREPVQPDFSIFADGAATHAIAMHASAGAQSTSVWQKVVKKSFTEQQPLIPQDFL